MADLFQPLHGITLIEGRQQLQHAARSGGQMRLARDGKLFLEAGVDDSDRGNQMLHGPTLSAC